MTASPPPVLFWQQLYCAAMAALYALLTVGGGAVMVWRERLADASTSALELLVTGGVLAVVGLPLAALFAAALFLPRRPWAWVYQVVLIAIGMTSCCCLPFVVPLLIFWIRPEVQAYFGRLGAAPTPA
jgi:hypothetical protein